MSKFTRSTFNTPQTIFLGGTQLSAFLLKKKKTKQKTDDSGGNVTVDVLYVLHEILIVELL